MKHTEHTDEIRGSDARGQLAYQDVDFLNSDDGRPVRILAEYLAPLRAFRRAGVHDTIVFFGSARIRPGDPLGRYYDEARQLAGDVTRWAQTLSSHRCRLVVCSGGWPWHHGGSEPRCI